MTIDTKAIRTKLMLAHRAERIKQNKPVVDANDNYYDGVMDALTEVEQVQNPLEQPLS